jgi:hypothetical protein
MSLRMDNDNSTRQIISYCPYRNIFFGLLEDVFTVYFWKIGPKWLLISRLFCEWWQKMADHSHLSVLYVCDRFFNRYDTPYLKTCFYKCVVNFSLNISFLSKKKSKNHRTLQYFTYSQPTEVTLCSLTKGLWWDTYG